MKNDEKSFSVPEQLLFDQRTADVIAAKIRGHLLHFDKVSSQNKKNTEVSRTELTRELKGERL